MCFGCCSGSAGVLARPQEIRRRLRQHLGGAHLLVLVLPNQCRGKLVIIHVDRRSPLPRLQMCHADDSENARRTPFQVSTRKLLPIFNQN